MLRSYCETDSKAELELYHIYLSFTRRCEISVSSTVLKLKDYVFVFLHKECVMQVSRLVTFILLSFIWIFFDTRSDQYFSPKKSQNILPSKAFTQASRSSSSASTWASGN